MPAAGVLLVERRDAKQGAVMRAWLDDHVIPPFSGRILPVDEAVARQCAKLHVPDPRSDRDALIAATGLVHGMTNATRNVEDFDAVGLKNSGAAASRMLSSTLMATPNRPSRHRYTYEEYLAYERDSELKHEYEDGEITAMAGGSRRHNALALRVGAVVDTVRSRGCVAFQSDQKIRVLATGKATYPDVSMVCGSIEGDPADPAGATITNPTLIVEVLSPSTEEEDRSNKWRHYQLLPSLQDYVLVSQGSPRVEIFRRASPGVWEYRDVREGTVQLSCGAVPDVAALYDGLPD